MPELDDQQLLNEFAATSSEAAFATLVGRYVNLVYSTAMRFTHDSQAAEEVSQAVFILLARKADSMKRGTILSGWLYQTARLTAANYLKYETRRRQREQEAYMQSSTTDPDPATWTEIAPLLDEAMGGLGETDRNAVVLRFFENKTSREVAAALKLTEAAAHKRVSRALEKLRHFFTKRGVLSTTAIIAGTISANSVHAAPSGLANMISTVALAKGAAVSTSTLTLVKGAWKIMAWKKTIATVAVCSGLLVVGVIGTGLTIKAMAWHREEDLWARINRIANGGNWNQVEKLPAAVSIRPTKFYPRFSDVFANDGRGKMLGLAMSSSALFGHAYAINRTRIANPEMLPAGKYDFVVTVPSQGAETLQRAIKDKFGLVATEEEREEDLFLLKVLTPNAAGLKSVIPNSRGRGVWQRKGHAKFVNEPASMLAGALAGIIGTPVIDQTSLSDHYDINLAWNDDRNALISEEVNKALLSELGLELVPTNMAVEMLVIEKAK